MKLPEARWILESVVLNEDGTTFRRTTERVYWFRSNALRAMYDLHKRFNKFTWPPITAVVIVRRKIDNA